MAEGDNTTTEIPPKPADPFSALAWEILYGKKMHPIFNAKSKIDQAMAVKELVSPDIPLNEFMELLRELNINLKKTNQLLEIINNKM